MNPCVPELSACTNGAPLHPSSPLPFRRGVACKCRPSSSASTLSPALLPPHCSARPGEKQGCRRYPDHSSSEHHTTPRPRPSPQVTSHAHTARGRSTWTRIYR
jgi:hypothetical protein